jgi:hypothetical protein
MNIKVPFMENIFNCYTSVLQNLYTPDEYKTCTVKRYDSTFLSLTSKLLHFGMTNGRKPKDDNAEKHQLKFTIGFDGVVPTSVKMYKDQTDISDDASFREAILANSTGPKDIAVFDRGCKKRTTFKEFWESDVLFVTRINPTTMYEERGSIQFSKNDHEDTEKLSFNLHYS